MLWKRVLSAVIGIIFIIFFIYLGTLTFALFAVIIVIFIGVKNIMRCYLWNYKYNRYLLSIYSIIIILYTYLNNKG